MQAAQTSNRKSSIAEVKLGLARAQQKTKLFAPARKAAQDALKIFTQLGMKPEINATNKLLSKLTLGLTILAANYSAIWGINPTRPVETFSAIFH